jgi:hypothetical protein
LTRRLSAAYRRTYGRSEVLGVRRKVREGLILGRYDTSAVNAGYPPVRSVKPLGRRSGLPSTVGPRSKKHRNRRI